MSLKNILQCIFYVKCNLQHLLVYWNFTTKYVCPVTTNAQLTEVEQQI